MKVLFYDEFYSIVRFKKQFKLDNADVNNYQKAVNERLIKLLQHFRKFPVFPVSFSVDTKFLQTEDKTDRSNVELDITYSFNLPTSLTPEQKSEIKSMYNHQGTNNKHSCLYRSDYCMNTEKKQFEIIIPESEKIATRLVDDFFDSISLEITKHNPTIINCERMDYFRYQENVLFKYFIETKMKSNKFNKERIGEEH